jgi:hypothetical protein
MYKNTNQKGTIMTIEEIKTVNWLLKYFNTSEKEDEKELYYQLNNKPFRMDFFCTEYKKLRSCDECPDWNSCPEH